MAVAALHQSNWQSAATNAISAVYVSPPLLIEMANCLVDGFESNLNMMEVWALKSDRNFEISAQTPCTHYAALDLNTIYLCPHVFSWGFGVQGNQSHQVTILIRAIPDELLNIFVGSSFNALCGS